MTKTDTAISIGRSFFSFLAGYYITYFCFHTDTLWFLIVGLGSAVIFSLLLTWDIKRTRARNRARLEDVRKSYFNATVDLEK